MHIFPFYTNIFLSFFFKIGNRTISEINKYFNLFSKIIFSRKCIIFSLLKIKSVANIVQRFSKWNHMKIFCEGQNKLNTLTYEIVKEYDLAMILAKCYYLMFNSFLFYHYFTFYERSIDFLISKKKKLSVFWMNWDFLSEKNCFFRKNKIRRSAVHRGAAYVKHCCLDHNFFFLST
jgi:hypothetical protein